MTTRGISTVNRFVQRLIGAAVLDVATYEAVEADRSGTGQAMLVVLIAALAAAVGARGFGASWSQVPAFIVMALLAWACWALLTYQIGSRLLPGAKTRTDVTELLRTIGFSTAPGILLVLGIVPAFTTPVFAVAAVWTSLAMIVAVRQALDYTSTARALAVCGLGWVLTLAFIAALGLLFSRPVS
jgi:hypothetical protein